MPFGEKLIREAVLLCLIYVALLSQARNTAVTGQGEPKFRSCGRNLADLLDLYPELTRPTSFSFASLSQENSAYKKMVSKMVG